jgi:DNA primase
MEGCSIRDAALKLAHWFNVSDGGGASPPYAKQPAASEELVAERRRGEEATDDIVADAGNKPLGFALRNIDHFHPYLSARGITPEIASHFGVGLFSGKGSMSGRVVIPIHNCSGELVAYAGRSIDATEPKYKFRRAFTSRSSFGIFTAFLRSGERRAGT